MKRASYRDAIDWIAQNDSAGDADTYDPGAAAYLITSVLVADIFGVDATRVGLDVVRRRDGKAHAIVPRGTGTTYTKAKYGEFT